tara:strand:- start:2023 stop:2151 length:129 start_codon:yes stop_codon:yes gene_type:complete
MIARLVRLENTTMRREAHGQWRAKIVMLGNTQDNKHRRVQIA